MFREFIKDFLEESREILARLDGDFVALEQDPGDRNRLDSIYGGIHTIKGSAGFFAFSKLEVLAHAGENLLSDITEGAVSVTPPVVTALLSMVDAVRTMLDAVEATGADGEVEYDSIRDTLEGLRSSCDKAAGEMNWEDAHREVTGSLPAVEDEPDPPPIEAPIQEPTMPVEISTLAPKDATAAGSIRVSVSLLDDLVSLIGELVLARNQVLQHAVRLQDRKQQASFQELDQITRALQEAIMKTRMQPIRKIFSKYPRIVRDLAVTCEKKVLLNLEGQDTELDKSLIEGISAPLTHLVRNAVDHGIESPSERIANGKTGEGHIRLSAYHEGGHVNIELEDDGRGIDLVRVKAKAVERGTLTKAQAAALTDAEAVNLIFESGFSTSEQVSRISGRGVGMDVVRKSLSGIRGTIDIQTVKGEGTTVRIKVPLTLAIIPALVVTCGGQRYAIPQINLREVVCIAKDNIASSIERIYDTPVYRLRGRLLPLLFLNRELGLTEVTDDMALALQGGALQIVVLSLDDRLFGLIVEGIHDTQEIVVKPLANLVRGDGCFAGATIMEDGRPALILDILRLAQRARVLTDVLDKPLFKVQAVTEEVARKTEPLLLFETPDRAKMALPVASVGRLELLPASKVETAGTRSVIQYRGKILPLVNVLSLLEGDHAPLPASREGLLPVVIHHHPKGKVGLVVGRIVDIAECEPEPPGPPSRRGVVGTRVIQGQATEMIDADALVELADSHLTIFKPKAVRGVEQHA